MQYRGLTSAKGFTIVELLIVIIVIGILATLVLIGYSNIQNKANDVSVKNDLDNIAKKLAYTRVTTGNYPSDNTGELATRGMGINQGPYDTNNAFNISYCFNFTTGSYIITSLSKSGNKFAISDQFPVRSISATATNDGLSSSSDCSDVGSGFYRIYAGYDKNNYYNGYVPGDSVPWRAWVLSPSTIN